MICCAEDEQKYDFCSKHYFAKFNVTFFSEENEIGLFSSLENEIRLFAWLENGIGPFSSLKKKEMS